MVMNELCIRCNKPTPYNPNTPITLRRYYVEGSGQLCEQCFYELYPQSGAFECDGHIQPARKNPNQNKNPNCELPR